MPHRGARSVGRYPKEGRLPPTILADDLHAGHAGIATSTPSKVADPEAAGPLRRHRRGERGLSQGDLVSRGAPGRSRINKRASRGIPTSGRGLVGAADRDKAEAGVVRRLEPGERPPDQVEGDQRRDHTDAVGDHVEDLRARVLVNAAWSPSMSTPTPTRPSASSLLPVREGSGAATGAPHGGEQQREADPEVRHGVPACPTRRAPWPRRSPWATTGPGERGSQPSS